ncbi:MAG: fibronectin type III domain-containing protein [Eubacterium sp.]
MKKVFSLFLSIVMLFSITAGLDLSAYADDELVSGSCGENVTYTFDSSDGVLTISGTGDMYNYDNANAVFSPWYDSKELIKLVVMENGVTSIGSFAFSDFPALRNIILSESITKIYPFAFFNSVVSETIYIPASVENLTEAFQFCSLEGIEVSVDNQNYSSEDGVLFSKNKKILYQYPTANTNETYKLPDSVIQIQDYSFAGSKFLSYVDFNNVDYIGSYTFYLTGIKNIYIPSTVNHISVCAFMATSELSSIIVAADNPNYVSEDNVLFNKDKTELIQYPAKNSSTEYNVPSSITYINDGAFALSENLTNIIIPNNVTDIGYLSFGLCTNLQRIIIKNPNCEIYDDEFTISDTATIYGYSNSTAEEYADKFNRVFISLDNCSAGNHTWDKGVITQAETCISTGIKLYTCTICGESYTETISMLGHSFSNYMSDNNAACTEDGTKTSKCDRCDVTDIITDKGSATGHTVVTDNAVVPTCTTAGKTAGSHCSVCGVVITAQKTVAATGHTYNSGVVTKKATCTSTGVKTYTCTKCGATKTSSVAKTTHTYKTTTTKATTSKNGSVVTKCSVCGAVKSKSTIYYPKTITLSATSYTYDGKVKKPTVTVKDSKGNKISSSNYTVSYSSGCKNVGTYTVTIKFKGNYGGTVKKTFTIKPKATSISSVTAKSKGFTVKWKKLTTQTTGYQIQYSTSSKFTNAKTVTVSKNSTTSKTISKLSAKKKYYVRVRTYKTVNGKKIYSAWSKAKTVTTKK